jgi:hypothetical protein
MTSSVLANSKYLQGRLVTLIDPTREANRVLIVRCARLEVQIPPATRFFDNHFNEIENQRIALFQAREYSNQHRIHALMNRYLIVCGNDVNRFIAPVTTPGPCSISVVPGCACKVS